MIGEHQFLLKELTLDFMKRLNAADLEDMLKDSGVESAIHRDKIIDAVLNSDDESFTDSMFSEPAFDVYLSYPKNGGAELASLIKIQLEMRDFTSSMCASKETGSTGLMSGVSLMSSSSQKETRTWPGEPILRSPMSMLGLRPILKQRTCTWNRLSCHRVKLQ